MPSFFDMWLPLSATKKTARCDHELVIKDDSFDHEFGCEQIFYYECELCGATHEDDNTIPEQVD